MINSECQLHGSRWVIIILPTGTWVSRKNYYLVCERLVPFLNLGLVPIIYDINTIPSIDSDWKGKLKSTLKGPLGLWSGNRENASQARSLEGNEDIETTGPLERGGPSHRKRDEESSGHIGHIVSLLRNLPWLPSVYRSCPGLLAWPLRSCTDASVPLSVVFSLLHSPASQA